MEIGAHARRHNKRPPAQDRGRRGRSLLDAIPCEQTGARRDGYCEGGAAPALQSERPLSTAFQLPCPNPTAAYSRTHTAKHKGRTAAVIFITKLERILLPDPSTDAGGSSPCSSASTVPPDRAGHGASRPSLPNPSGRRRGGQERVARPVSEPTHLR